MTIQHIKELEKDVLSLKLTEHPILKRNNFIKINVPYNKLAEYYYRLLINYCEQSTNYTILVSLLRKDTNSVLSISEKTNFSVSYIYSRMKDINAFLFHYGVKIDFSKPGKKTIVGNELQLHYCILDIYWNIHSNIAVHFSKNHQQQVMPTLNIYVKKEAIQNLESGMLDKLYLLIHFCLKNFPINSIGDIREQLQNLPNAEIFADPYFDILKPDSHLSNELRSIINILSRILISKTETSEINVKQYELLRTKGSSQFSYSKELIETFANEFKLRIPEDEKIIYILNFLRNQIYYDVLTKNHPNTTMASYLIYAEKEQTDIEEKVRQFYQHFKQINQTRYPFIEQQNQQWLLEDLIHIYDRYCEKEKIVIGVNFTRDYYINDDLCSQIEQHFGSNNVLLKKKAMRTCDIIISDCFINDLPEKTKIIYLIDGDITSQKIKDMFKQLSDHLFDLRQE
ncbi:hypothetical protein IGI39_003899 [Enterococcus sp. AZ135]